MKLIFLKKILFIILLFCQPLQALLVSAYDKMKAAEAAEEARNHPITKIMEQLREEQFLTGTILKLSVLLIRI